MSEYLKTKHVLFCGNLTHFGINFFNNNNTKTLTIANDDLNHTFANKDNVKYLQADVTKIKDLEDVYKLTLDATKSIDIVINSKEMRLNDNTWEADITKHINSMICSTLMAMKCVGKMNFGCGCMVANVLTIFDDDADATDAADADASSSKIEGISSLLNDLDRCFSDPYYYASTGVRILTMCRYIHSSLMGINGWNQWQDDLIKVLRDKKSLLWEKSIEQFDIYIEK